MQLMLFPRLSILSIVFFFFIVQHLNKIVLKTDFSHHDRLHCNAFGWLATLFQNLTMGPVEKHVLMGAVPAFADALHRQPLHSAKSI
jgi:hypothetical protein